MEGPDTSSQNDSSAALRRSRPATTSGSLIDLFGVAVELAASDDDAAAALDGVLEAGAPASGAPEMFVTVQRAPLPVPDRRPDGAYDDLDYWSEAHGPTLRVPGGTVAIVTDTHVVVGGGDLRDGLHRCLPLVLAALMEHRACYLLHGAAVGVEGGAALALGPSLRGKSTLAAAALREGRVVWADDVVAVRATPDGIEVSGLAKPLSVPAELGIDGAVVRRDRRRLPAGLLGSGSAPLVAVVVLAHGTTPRGGLRPLTGTVVLPELIRSVFRVGDRPPVTAFFAVVAAMARVPAFELAHGTDAASRLDVAGGLLDNLDTALVADAPVD